MIARTARSGERGTGNTATVASDQQRTASGGTKEHRGKQLGFSHRFNDLHRKSQRALLSFLAHNAFPLFPVPQRLHRISTACCSTAASCSALSTRCCLADQRSLCYIVKTKAAPYCGRVGSRDGPKLLQFLTSIFHSVNQGSQRSGGLFVETCEGGKIVS